MLAYTHPLPVCYSPYGNVAHGGGVTQDEVRFQYPPALSQHVKDWFRTKLLARAHNRQIVKDSPRFRLAAMVVVE